MTTDPHDEHGEILRRALQAEAESVIPGADGLERIRARIDERSARRFGRDWFLGFAGPGAGVAWARPVLAVAAAALIAGIGVTAPQTIDLIQSAGNGGTSEQEQQGHGGDGRTVPQGVPPNAQPPASPGPSDSGDATETGSPSPEKSTGSTACATPPDGSGTPTVSASAGKGSAGAASGKPCPTGAPTTPTTPTDPPDTGTPEPDPTEPTQAPATDPPAPAQAEEPAA